MNVKLLFREAAIGVLISIAVILSSLVFIFYIAPKWANYVFEDYIIVLVLIGLLPVSANAYKEAVRQKILYAVAVFFLSIILLIFVIALACLILLLAIRLYCQSAGCSFFPL